MVLPLLQFTILILILLVPAPLTVKLYHCRWPRVLESTRMKMSYSLGLTLIAASRLAD